MNSRHVLPRTTEPQPLTAEKHSTALPRIPHLKAPWLGRRLRCELALVSCIAVFVSLHAQTPPAITTQPSDRSVSIGASTTLRSVFAGDAPLFFQWYFNNVALEGATGSSLAIPNSKTVHSGGYHVVVTNEFGAATSLVAKVFIDGTFTKILTNEAAIILGNISEASWGDYDNDGWTDLFVAMGAGWGNPRPSFLLRNLGNGAFTRITQGTIVNRSSDLNQAVWGDLDNDGFLDLTSVGYDQIQHGTMFRNQGNGTFATTPQFAITQDAREVQAIALGDYNNDGILDFAAAGVGAPIRLYRGRGDGTFVAETNVAPVTEPGSVGVPGWVDFDDDGDQDLFVAGYGNDQLFRNHGNGTFSRVVDGPQVSDRDQSNGFAWGDYDSDGDFDLCVAVQGSGNRLYRNQGDGTFEDVTSSALPTEPIANSQTVSWADYDNDGYLDLFITNDRFPPGDSHFLYRNRGDGTFQKITTGSLVTDISRGGGGCSWGDYNNDGFLDLFVTAANSARSHFYHNNGNGNGWIKIKCIGRASNRSAIGARVRVTSTAGGKILVQGRQIGMNVGRNQSDLVAHFGLGQTPQAVRVRIDWPSGISQEMSNVLPGQLHTITEPDVALSPSRVSASPNRSVTFVGQLGGAAGATYEWRFNGVLLADQRGSTLTIPAVGSAHSGKYTVTLRGGLNPEDSISASAALEPLTPPRITSEPHFPSGGARWHRSA